MRHISKECEDVERGMCLIFKENKEFLLLDRRRAPPSLSRDET